MDSSGRAITGGRTLSAKTGALVWGFQLVHHDLWDYDTASQPVLATVHRYGVETSVVIHIVAFRRSSAMVVFRLRLRDTDQALEQHELCAPGAPNGHR
jgi:quinoprotein glucose dehydrogenase